MKPDILLQQIARLIDARSKTSDTLLRSEMKGLEAKLQAEIKASENRTKKELKEEIRDLRTGVAKRIIQQDEQIEELKEAAGTSSKH